MKFAFIKLSTLVCATALLAACGSGNGNSPTNATAAYIGDWATGCTASQLEQLRGIYFDYRFKATANEWQLIQSGYFDAGCTVQTQGTEEENMSIRGTITFGGTYTDIGSATTAEGLQANNLETTVTSFNNTIQENTDDSPIGSTETFVVYVDDSDVHYIDGSLIGIGETPGNLLLTLPFNKAQ